LLLFSFVSYTVVLSAVSPPRGLSHHAALETKSSSVSACWHHKRKLFVRLHSFCKSFRVRINRNKTPKKWTPYTLIYSLSIDCILKQQNNKSTQQKATPLTFSSPASLNLRRRRTLRASVSSLILLRIFSNRACASNRRRWSSRTRRRRKARMGIYRCSRSSRIVESEIRVRVDDAAVVAVACSRCRFLHQFRQQHQ
jgi:hypothetical protein